jgi:hypothetical protein
MSRSSILRTASATAFAASLDPETKRTNAPFGSVAWEALAQVDALDWRLIAGKG